MGTDALPPTDRMIPESLVREFIGYLSGAVPELHRVEVPLLAKHWDDFKWTVGDRLSGEPAPATTDRVAPSFDAWWNDDAYGCLRYSDPVQFDRLRQAFNAGVAAARAAPEPGGDDVADKLWQMCVEDGWPWSDGSIQDKLTEIGLLYPKDMTQEDESEQCTNCEGDCRTCYRAVEHVRDAKPLPLTKAEKP